MIPRSVRGAHDLGPWRAPGEPPALARGEVHVWRVPTAGAPADVERWSTHLSAGERALAARKRFARDRDEVLVSHGALRAIVARYVGGSPADVAFRTGEHGKPALDPNPSGVCFNLSHSGGMALVGVARELEIGVDVEHRERLRADADLPRTVLSERELVHWSAVPAADRAELFLRVWTGKEAVLKASGAGLSIDPRSFDVLERDARTGDCRILAAVSIGAGASFDVRELDVGASCTASLAAAGTLASIRCFDVPGAWADRSPGVEP